jgi:VWFA-related protein
MRGFAICCSCVLAAAVLVARPQQPTPTFRTGTQLLVRTVTVKDRAGKPIEGLTAGDFAVTEDGRPQTIAFVEYQPLDDSPVPRLAAPVATVPPVVDTGVAVPGDARYRGRRLLVIYFDLYSTTFFDEIRMYESAARFITANMSQADLVAVMAFQNGHVTLKQDFTDDRALLRRVVMDMASAANDRQNEAGAALEAGGAFGEDTDAFNLFSTDRQLAALQTAINGLDPLPEIKTLVYLGAGLRLNGADNQAQLRATVNAAVRANVTINPVDVHGLVAEPPLGDATRASPGGVGMFSGALAQTATLKQQQAQDTYYALARDTGGRAMFDNNDLALGIAQAAHAATGYYIVGYYTSNTAADGRLRHVKIAVTRGVSADLAYRTGYYGAKPFAKLNTVERERQLEDALALEDPITDIAMAVEVNCFQLNRDEYFVPVSVRMPGGDLLRSLQAGGGRARIDIIAEVKDTFGVTVRNAKDYLTFSMNPAQAAAARRPVQYETGFTLLPGGYVVKVVARDATTGRIGTFQQSFTVPNLERETVRLPISTVVLTHQRAGRGDALFSVKEKIASDVGNPLVFGGRKLIPAVGRTFHAGQPVYVFLQAYEGDPRAMHPLVAFVTLYAQAAKVFDSGPYGVSDWDAGSRVVPIRLTLSLDTVAPGRYDCQVSVLDTVAGRAAFWRTSIAVVR